VIPADVRRSTTQLAGSSAADPRLFERFGSTAKKALGGLSRWTFYLHSVPRKAMAAVTVGHPGGIFGTGNGPLWFAP